MITEPGEYALDKAAYDADPCQVPSLRSSIAWLLASKTPAHAWYENPRLNTKYVRKEKRHFDIGSYAHAKLLRKGGSFVHIDAPNYKKKAAQDERDRAYAQGKTPLLYQEVTEINQMVLAVNRQIGELLEYGTLTVAPFQHNETERCIVWREDNGVWCRAALDGLSLDGETLSEFKTEGESANPDQWQWKARRMGYVFKLAFYCRGLAKLKMAYSPNAQFFVAETAAPWLLSLVRVDDELFAVETERVIKSIKLWGNCLSQNRWPGYSMDGYDLTLTERERQKEAAQGGGFVGHLSSEDIANGLGPSRDINA